MIESCPTDELKRLEALHSYDLLETGPDPRFDQLTALAGYLFKAPIALISLIDSERQWCKSRFGVPSGEMSRDESFCTHAILEMDGLVVPDALLDRRFASLPWVREKPYVRFYAGATMRSPEGYALGTLCILDNRPRSDFDASQFQMLSILAQQAITEANFRKTSRRLLDSLQEQQRGDLLRQLQWRMGAAISASHGYAPALQSAVEEICGGTGWMAGAAWSFGEREGKCVGWHSLRSDFDLIRETFEHQSLRADRIADLVSGTVVELGGDDVASRLGFTGKALFPIRADGISALLEFWIQERNEDTPILARLVSEAISQASFPLERKVMEERLRQQDTELRRISRAKDRFLAMLAHELRNPLTPILNAVELLRTPQPGDAVEVIERQVRHLSRLVDDLLDVSQIRKGKMTFRKVRIDLCESVRAAAQAAQGVFAERGQPFHITIPAEPIWIAGDAVRIEQIVGNLLNNAAKYADPGKAVSLSLALDGEEALLKVADEGIGIAPEMLEQVFEPFVQVAVPSTETKGGLGLGLAVVQQLVALHGGHVFVESEGLGLGSQFTVRLPIYHEGEVQGTAKKREPKKLVTAKRVMIIEDYADGAETLRRLLIHWGHEVETASSGVVALNKAVLFRPDVALIDIGLPGMDGYTVAREFCNIPELAEVRLVAMTGHDHQSDRDEAAAAGFRHYLIKPVAPAALREAIEIE